MIISIPEKKVEIQQEIDVLVIGGGPAGIGAAVSAARQGAKVMLVEKRGFLGGNITASYVQNCNHFMYKTSFHATGVYAEIENKYEIQYGDSHDARPNYPLHIFSSEYLKVFLDNFILDEGIELKLHSFVNDVVVENNKITAVIIQTKKGPVAIKAAMIVDATGDGDVAFSAGVPFEQGRSSDGVNQPGTVNFRIAGVNVEKLAQSESSLRELSNELMKEITSGKTGLTCKRHWPGFGRLTKGGQITGINFADVYHIDPTDIDGLTRGEIDGRKYAMEMFHYLKQNVDGMKDIEISSFAPEIGFRDSRRIEGHYRLTSLDIETGVKFDDVITVFPRFYDMLALDGDWSKGRGLDTDAVYTPPEPGRVYQIPYRCLVPKKINNLLMAGRCICSDHLAESTIRAIAACMLIGQAAGTGASMACRSGIRPIEVDIKELQAELKQQGVELP